MANLNLKVKGMHCASCEMLLKDILTDEGAKKVSASFKEAKVSVEFDEKKLSADKIKQLIKAEGYEVE